MDIIVLRLYVLNSMPSSMHIVTQVKQMLEEEIPEKYVLEVIDVESDIQQAEKDNILAVPALVRVGPDQVIKKIIGDFSNREHLLAALGLPFKREK